MTKAGNLLGRGTCRICVAVTSLPWKIRTTLNRSPTGERNPG